MTEPVPTFKLTNSSDSFSAKSNDIFGCLSVIEKKHEAYQKTQKEEESESVLKPDPEDDDIRPDRSQRSWRDRNQSSRPHRQNRQEFTRPYPPSRNRCNRANRRTPDFKVNPDRWTKYSLEDIEGKDMSESSNTRAAFAFLDERRKLREMEADPQAFECANVEETACSRGAITFVRKKKDKTEAPVEKTKDNAVLQVDVDEEAGSVLGDNLGEEKETPKSEEKVSFKSKKGKKRNIRTRHSDDEEEGDQNG